jgi:fatty acid desaturase
MVHLANIGPRGRRRRLLFGLVMLAAGLAVVVTDLVAGSRWWLVAIFALIWGGVLGVLQARGHT